ncbi:MAG: hypothetical protein U0930_12475 [Pirellulales bacterium]
MLHSLRMWGVQAIEWPESLACKLTNVIWPHCRAYELKGYIFANDTSLSGGTQEYAVLKPARSGNSLTQIESITFSYCTEQSALERIEAVCSGVFDGNVLGNVERIRFEAMFEHCFCIHCVTWKGE